MEEGPEEETSGTQNKTHYNLSRVLPLSDFDDANRGPVLVTDVLRPDPENGQAGQEGGGPKNVLGPLR